MANGLSFSSREPQINVFATFAAFFEGIAREGFEFWRYQRNLTGANEGLNVILHLSHVGDEHGPRSLLGLEPRLDQPGARLPAVPAPVLRARRTPGRRSSPCATPPRAWAATSWRFRATTCRCSTTRGSASRCGTPATRGRPSTVVPRARRRDGRRSSRWARRRSSPARPPNAPTAQGMPADVYVVNGFPLDDGVPRRPGGALRSVVTVEDGLIGNPTRAARLRGARGHAPGGERRAPRAPRASPIRASRRRTTIGRCGSTSA